MKKLTLIEIQDRIKQRFPLEDFDILEYNGLGKPGKVKCNNCQRIIIINKFSNFFVKSKKYGCSNCQSHNLIQRQKILEELNNEYIILFTEVKGTHTYYTVKCKKCGHVRCTTLRDFKRHLRCGCQTSVKRNRAAKEFIDEVNQYSQRGTYTLISPYVNQTTKVLLKHDCGFIWEVRPGDIIHGRSSCPKCARKESNGEFFIKTILQKYSIPFQQEKRLNNSKQRFDFYLENNIYKIAIEFNGAQHYKETNFFKGSLETFQKRDKIKQQYCIDNGIELYIIPYTWSKEEIELKIKEIIHKFNDYPVKE